MKMFQAPKFQPITMTIETNDEAMYLWDIVEAAYKQFPSGSPQRELAVKMSNWFSMEAQLGGEENE